MAHRLSLYRPVGDSGEPYPQWVRDLKKKSGIYVIRSSPSFLGLIGGQVLYVGESHTGRMYGTLTRHFQQWSSDTNVAYDRDRVEVAIRLSDDADHALTLQRYYICELKPEDNLLQCEEVPF